MENHKIGYKWQFSIAILNYQRVDTLLFPLCPRPGILPFGDVGPAGFIWTLIYIILGSCLCAWSQRGSPPWSSLRDLLGLVSPPLPERFGSGFAVVLIWTKHCKAIGILEKGITCNIVPSISTWFWRRLLCLFFLGVCIHICMIGRWIDRQTGMWRYVDIEFSS